MESWGSIFIAIAILGLFVGWIFNNALVGLVLIWVGMIAAEVLSFVKKKSKRLDKTENEDGASY
jgi:hypothetical protein